MNSRSQHHSLSRFSRLRMQEKDGALHRNISALVLNIRDEGPAFARGARKEAEAVPAAVASPAPIPAAPFVASGSRPGNPWKTAFWCLLLAGLLAVGGLGWLSYVLDQRLAVLDAAAPVSTPFP